MQLYSVAEKSAVNFKNLKMSTSRYVMFGSVVTIAFQITFRAEIHANDIFLFFKNYF